MPDTQITDATVKQSVEQFFSAAEGREPTDDERALISSLTYAVRRLGQEIIQNVPNGRNKSLALTALEEVQMRANRAIFDPQASRFPATSNNPEGSR